MKRSALIICAALAAGFAGGARPHAGSAATTNISYDEIVKFAITSTPPPPGSFQSDYASITSGQSAAVATPSPAPKKHGLFGGFDPRAVAQSLAAGDNPGATLGDAASNAANGARDAAVDQAMDGMLNQQMKPLAAGLARFANGSLVHHAFYGNWERADDVATQTATIDKCDKHQRILLDLAKHTYRIEDTTPHATGDPSPSAARASCDRNEDTTQSAPGTGILDLTSTSTRLAPVAFDGAPAQGTRSTSTIAIEHATGSCRNGSYTVATTTYYSAYARTHPYCPLPAAYRHPGTPAEMVHPSGGCKLSTAVHADRAASLTANTLPYYEMMQLQASNGDRSRPITLVTERGNIRALGDADESLFEVPAGFTQAS